MAIEFTNTVKGLVTQNLLAALLERGGYRVTRLGIEELFAEVKHIDMQHYLKLNLPMPLRYLPDLLVAELDMSNVFLVEVKFRRRLDENTARTLHAELTQQLRYWPQAHTVIMVAKSFRSDATYHQDYIRMLKPGDIDNLVDATLIRS